jgi:quinol monooxygenase YgiN
MHILTITFELNGIDAEAYTAHCAKVAPHFARLPGLISKVWLADRDSNTYGGVYLWANRAALEAYLASETFAALKANPAFANVTARAFGDLQSATVFTAGPLAYTQFAHV